MTMLRRFTVRRVVIGAMSLLATLAVAGLVSLIVLASTLRQQMERQVTVLQEDEAIAESIVRHTHRQIELADAYVQEPSPDLLEAFRQEGMAVYDQIRLYLFRDLSREERVLVERLREAHERIEVTAQQAFAGDPATWRGPDLELLRREVAALLDLRHDESMQLLQAQARLWGRLYLGVAAMVGLFLAVVAAVTIFLRRRLVEPLSSISGAARRLAEGEYETRIDYATDDEMGAVARSLDGLAQRLHQARTDAARAERRYQDLVEGVSTVVWEADAYTLHCGFVSPQVERFMGYSVEEWLKPGIWRRVIHPDDYEHVVARCLEDAAAGRDHELEYRMVRADGRVLWVRDLVRVTLDEQGRPQRLRGVLTDITVARQAADALRESEERYHSLVDRVPLGLYRTTPDGRFVDANPALVQLLGYDSREELRAANATELYPDRAERLRWQRLVDAAPGVIEVDRQNCRRDGSTLWLRDRARAVRGADGEVLYYEGALQDVTERVRAEEAVRRSEARFRSLIENASDGVLVLDREAMVQYQSPAVERILGYTQDEMSAISVFDLVHPDDRSRVKELYRQLLTDDTQVQATELRCRHRDGGWRVVQTIGTNLLDDADVGGIVVNLMDVTAHRQLEAQFAQAQKMEAVGRLAGGIAHDFNNLLTAIEGYAALLADRTNGDDASQQDLEEIRRAVDRGAALTRQLLAFGRRQVVQRRPTDVGAVLGELEQMLRRVITEDVLLHTDLMPDCWVEIDPGQLEQVVLNLVVNARDAGPRTGIRLSVAPGIPEGDAALASPGEHVVLTVSDDGCGIGADDMPFIFEPFFTTKDVGKGTGLGLATVYSIAEQNGGHVRVDSTPGAGTSIRVWLPRVAAEPSDADPEAGRADAGRGRELVLLVEDEPAVRALAERVLQRQGYSVLTAGNGAEALDVVRSLPGAIDALVTDVVMPEMGGVELAEELATRQPGLRILFMSGYAPDDLPRSAGGRPLHFLEKPFGPAALAQAVRSVLDESLVST